MQEELPVEQQKLTRIVMLSAASIGVLFATICYVMSALNIWIPVILSSFSFLITLSYLWFLRHKKLTWVYLQGATLLYLVVVVINFFSGGIDGVFNLIFPILVISGYSMRKRYGRFWLILSFFTLILFYITDGPYIQSFNAIDQEFRSFFIFASVAVGIFIIGGVYGEYLVRLVLTEKLKSLEIIQKNVEKETLLKEIHHRVKNNMQVISGLLSIQSSFTNDPVVKEYFQLSQNRIKTMSIVHEMLYEENDLATIDLHVYLTRLVTQLIISMKGKEHKVVLNFDVESVTLNIDTAIPLGIFVNEIVTNSLKYGISGNERGTISVQVEKLLPPHFIMRIGDDGSGLDSGIELDKSKSFGLNLISNLAKQLRGDVILNPKKVGTHYILNFQEIIKSKI